MISLFQIHALASGAGFWERVAAWYRESLLRELLVYLKETYFSVELHAYENLHFSANASTAAQSIIFAIAIGLILAAAWGTYTRTVLGSFVRSLLKADATSEQNAKTLRELGFFRSVAIRRELYRGVDLKKLVKRASLNGGEGENAPAAENVALEGGEGENTSAATAKKDDEALFEKKPNFLTDRFYIPEELRYRAELRYEKKGSGWGAFAVTVVVSLLLAALIGRFLPDLLQLADNLITMTAPKG